MHTFLLCSPSCSAPLLEAWLCCDFDSDCREEICELRDERSCLMTYVSSLISTGLSSNSVFRFATLFPKVSTISQIPRIFQDALNSVALAFKIHKRTCTQHIRSASLPSFSIVPVMPRPISAALLANSDRTPLLGPLVSPFGDPLAARFWDSVSSDCLWAPIFVEDCRFCAWARTALNSAVRSCIDVVVIFEQGARAAVELKSSIRPPWLFALLR